MTVEWDKARKAARDLVDRYNITEPPVNVFDIAENEGIEVVFFKPDENTRTVSGILEKEKKRVYLNAAEPAKRQAYTLAHELAHYFLDHRPNEYGVYRRDTLHAVKLPREKEADMFAAELLMPRKVLIATKKKYHLANDDAAVLILAKIFAVSESAMKFRLKSLTSKYDEKDDEESFRA